MITDENTTLTERYQVRVDVNPDGIPSKFTRRPQWVVWKLEERDGKLTKIPYSATTGSKADTTDLMTWAPFSEALEAYESGGYLGVGFVFCSGDKFAGVDLDECRDPESGIIEAWAMEIIEKFKGAYVEVSPSGEGVHIIAHGKLSGGKRKGPIEIYDMERFFCVTGVTV